MESFSVALDIIHDNGLNNNTSEKIIISLNSLANALKGTSSS